MKKYASTPRGYDSSRMMEKDPWWQYPAFPLIPQFEYREGNERSSNNWSLSWLWFRVWTIDSFGVELSVELESTGLNVKGIFGWLRVVIRVIPLPDGWDIWLRRKYAKR